MNLWRILGVLTIGLIPLSPVPQASGTPPQPLVLLYVRDPWLTVIGSDSPRFALYDNGLVIYASGKKKHEEAFLAKLLSLTELKELLTTLDLERRLGGLDGKKFSASWNVDQPKNQLRYWVNGQPRAIEVYGPPHGRAPGGESVPKPFLEVFDALTGFRAKGAKPWLPPQIEVMIWPFDYSRETPKPWPKEWPGLDDPATKKRGDTDYSLFLDSRHFSDFLNLLRSLKSTQAVLIGDKKWGIAYRFPFPGGY
jgi:hypothetical protein